MRNPGFQTNTIQTVQLLQRAAREHVVALIEPRSEGGAAPFNVEIVSISQNGLTVQPPAGETRPSDAIIGVYCDAQVVIGETPYVFETFVLAIDDTDGRPVVTLNLPEQFTILERRMKPRVQLARSSDVHIRWGSPMEPQTAVARLLNLSAQGIACQLDATAAAGILLGDSAEISLPLGGEDDWIHLPATIRNKTEGSSPTAVLVGMEFNQQRMPADLIERLRRHVSERTETRVNQ